MDMLKKGAKMQLSKDFIDKQRTALLQEKSRLEGEIKKLDKYPDYGDKDDDNDMELRDYENNRSIEDQLTILLEKVKSALESIDNGNYGKCKKCGEMIKDDRLDIMPYAEVCVACLPKK